MQKFFISGYNKSGTTFLQMLMNAYPGIFCPSEQFFNLFLQTAEQLSTNYEKQIHSFDQNTAKQGIPFDKSKFFSDLVKQAVTTQFESKVPKQTTHIGLNDNSIIEKR